MVTITNGVIFMKEKRKPIQTIKKLAILLFCTITVTMNIVNYVRADASKGLGTVYQWSQEAEIAGISGENRSFDVSDAEEEKTDEIEDFKLVNLNTADSEELQTLKGIGPSKAAAIIEYRSSYGTFLAPEEIMEVPGIGEGIYAKIKDSICIE